MSVLIKDKVSHYMINKMYFQAFELLSDSIEGIGEADPQDLAKLLAWRYMQIKT
jgi:hypothetical protein